MATLRQQVIGAIATLVTFAFGLVAALAWNQAIVAIVKYFLGTADSIPGLLTYAIVVTILAVIATILIARAAAKAGAEVKESLYECILFLSISINCTSQLLIYLNASR